MSEYGDNDDYEYQEYEYQEEEENIPDYERDEDEYEPEYHEYEEEYIQEFEDVPEYREEEFQEEEYAKGLEMNAFGEGGRLYFMTDRDSIFRKFESTRNKSQLQRFQEIIAMACSKIGMKEKIDVIIPYTDYMKEEVINLNAPCFVLGYLCIKRGKTYEIDSEKFNNIIKSENMNYIDELNKEFGSNIKIHDVLRYAKFWINLLNEKNKKR